MTQTHHPGASSAAGGDPERTTEVPVQEAHPVWFGQPDAPSHPPLVAPSRHTAPPLPRPRLGRPPAPPRGGAEPAQPAKPRRWLD